MVERRIRAAHFSAVKSFDTFDFTAIPSLNKPLTLELARCEYLIARDNVIALGNSGTGKTHVCLALGLAACQRGLPGLLLHRGRPRSSIDGSARRAASPETPGAARRRQTAHRRRTRLCAALADRRGASLRNIQPASRTRLDHRHVESSL